MTRRETLFTSESVTEGHPDKICDQVSDAILDAALTQDPEAKTAIECFINSELILIGGELTTTADINIENIVRRTLKDIGYTKKTDGFNAETGTVKISLNEQSPDIKKGISPTQNKEQGAGDQGMMFGYATNETSNYLPLPITLSHALTKRLADVRKQGILPYIRPDGKAQVTVKYQDHAPINIHTVVVSTQHLKNIPQSKIREDIKKHVIKPVLKNKVTKDTKIYVNPAGRFVIGGPQADTGLTGRKIIVDTYGGMGRHGGGAFSGKDPSKVDRSGAYLARYIAKNIVAANLADRCEVQIAYAIGIAEPVSITVDTFGTSNIAEKRIERLIPDVFSLKPRDVIEELDLEKPIYEDTATYGHFKEGYSWEETDKVPEIQRLLR